MRALVQRVVRAEVASHATPADTWAVVGSIGAGLCIFVGVTHDDDPERADRLAAKIFGLRVFDDDAGVMNRSLDDLADAARSGGPATDRRAEGEMDPAGVVESDRHGALVVSQFTLYGDTRKGRRPSWVGAARPEHAEPLVERVVDRLRELGGGGLDIATGRFRTEMQVELVNDGPVTLLLEV